MTDWKDNTDLTFANQKVAHLIDVLAAIQSDWAYDGVQDHLRRRIDYELGDGLSRDRRTIERQVHDTKSPHEVTH